MFNFCWNCHVNICYSQLERRKVLKLTKSTESNPEKTTTCLIVIVWTHFKGTHMRQTNQGNFDCSFLFLYIIKKFHQCSNIQNNSFWSCDVLGQDTFYSNVRLWAVLEKGSIRETTPSTHLSQPKPFQTVSSPESHKKWKELEGSFLHAEIFPLFHTPHWVKLHPNSLNRNLKAILFQGKNEVAQTVMIWPDCTLTCLPPPPPSPSTGSH